MLQFTTINVNKKNAFDIGIPVESSLSRLVRIVEIEADIYGVFWQTSFKFHCYIPNTAPLSKLG